VELFLEGPFKRLLEIFVFSPETLVIVTYLLDHISAVCFKTLILPDNFFAGAVDGMTL
jgi:hypothetical protein